ncbi:hypothetical protein CEXT_387201 [Caerostris extrusa]|uniref:Uncharacterized protein n=1 Tax=Caerostris extrusa TaxID=172846 RepID=A0AAV4P6V5_CAEEX|nr:hypothetical protein CEXT_387201 [Caerostris extrusa]
MQQQRPLAEPFESGGARAEQFLDDGLLCQGARVAQVLVVTGDLPQDPAQDLPGPGLGQAAGHVDEVGGGEGAYLGTHCGGEEIVSRQKHFIHVITFD